MKRIAIVALGGNALLRKGEGISVETQFRNVRTALQGVVWLIKKGYKVVITHGNGPQVGALMLRSEKSKKVAYPVPMDVAGAQSQGEIGYMIQQSLENILKQNGMKNEVVSVITQVEVSKKDSAFREKTKPVGAFYSRLQAYRLRKEYDMVYDSGRGYRRVVASPKPLRIVESDVIKKLVLSGAVVIAVGGGGIPVVKSVKGYRGVEAVIDKDSASACLGKYLKAELLLILTSVKGVALGYGTEREKWLKLLSVKDAIHYMQMNEFASGSMKPKIEAAIEFLKSGGKKVIVTMPSRVKGALLRKSGTVIEK